MKRIVDRALVARALVATAFAAMLAIAPVQAQTAAKPPSATAIGYAKEILAAKQVSKIYDDAIPGLVQRVKNALLSSNLNYQKDLNEVALKVAKDLNGREKEIGNEMAKIYASEFTEAELKELVTFYKSPVGKKVIEQEPKAFDESRQFMDKWAEKMGSEIHSKFSSEMKARGKPI
jgi:hypothetical protein